jgi:Sec-independent protein secretion pathway component TatC
MTFSDLKKVAGIESSGHLEFHLRKLAHLIRTNQDGSYTLTDDGREAVRIIQTLRSDGMKSVSSRGARNAVWPKVVLVVLVALLVAFMAIPSGLTISIGPGGTYRPLVSVFVAEINQQLLPAGWTLISSGGITEPLEVYFAASLILALLFASPLVAFQVVRFLGPALARQRSTTYTLVVIASALLATGALFGYFVLANLAVHGMAPQSTNIFAPGPFIDAVGFYIVVLGTISASAVAFTLPVYIFVRVRFRTPKQRVES